ncbi:hypothetical protein CCC_00535 [Paramagnetospirillum magnetotacticum MS-1]|uniref:Uncharacterized protein n=1 Tax=Paramagnetospirillum magnetotacticum MS-1 TaxID=272627 RepID=A0A0C2YCL7_PARME|nr:hypothetical protein CCC_00535 [Paramagnetospirillum magnetotacticum MS-1]
MGGDGNGAEKADGRNGRAKHGESFPQAANVLGQRQSYQAADSEDGGNGKLYSHGARY